MKAPPDIQISSLLWFLKEALRQDEYIQKWTEAAPTEIVAQTVEYQPIQREKDGYAVYASQSPVLALNVATAVPTRIAARWGRVSTLELWYLFKSMQAEGLELHGFEKNERWKSLIAWRIVYWLKKQKLPANDSTEVFDLQDVSKIRKLDITAIEWLDIGSLQGLKFTLTMEHAFAPYEEIDPPTWALMDFSVYTHDPDTPETPELTVEADID